MSHRTSDQLSMLALPWEQAKAKPAAPVDGPLFAGRGSCLCSCNVPRADLYGVNCLRCHGLLPEDEP